MHEHASCVAKEKWLHCMEESFLRQKLTKVKERHTKIPFSRESLDSHGKL